MENIKLISDIDGTIYKQNDIVDYGYIKSLQIQKYSKIMREFRINKSINILTRGDSLSYGYDTNSLDKRVVSPLKTDLDTAHKVTRASKNYPEALKEYIDNVYGIGSCSIENIGYSGAWVKYSFDEYYKFRTNNLEIIMLGTNDSRLANCPYKGDVTQYSIYYEQLIIREILMGNALVIMLPIQTKMTKDLDVETFRVACKMLAEKYSIPCLDASEMLESYEHTIWSDNTHLTGEGYTTLGYRVGSALLNENMIAPKIIDENSVLLMSPTQDSCYYKGDSLFYNASSGYTPNSIDGDRIACRLNSGGEIIYTFYSNQEGLVALPSLFMYEDAKLEISLDNKIRQAKYRNVHTMYSNSTWDGSNPSSVTLTNVKTSRAYSKSNIVGTFGDSNVLKINNKGWHTLTFKNVGTTAINLFGVEFLSSEDYSSLNKLKYRTLFDSAVGVSSGNIILSDEISNFNSFVIYYDFAGVGSVECDFNSFARQSIRVSNLSNSSGVLTEYVSELGLSMTNELTLNIELNKAIVRAETGIATAYTNNPMVIKKIIGKI